MARSSGGGSRSGGSRGGGSRSRSRSGGGSRSGGKSYTHSKTPKAGCDKYLYYDKNGKAQFVWCNYDPSEKRKFNPLRLILLFFYFPFFFAIATMIASSLFIPQPLSQEENPYSEIYIEDNLNVIEDKETLANTLSSFYQKTGVTPAVITVPKEIWQYYSNLETYALELYYSHFNDECHWLIVYSEPITEEFNDWQWEGIIGDDTVKAISDSDCERLTDTMQKNLYRGNGVGKAIADTFSYVASENKVQINFAELGLALFVSVFITFHAFAMLGVFSSRKTYKGAVKVEEKIQIIKCEYCGGTYGSDVTLACPHCNAPVTTPEGIFVKESNSNMV